jgi:hypothetical protein
VAEAEQARVARPFLWLLLVAVATAAGAVFSVVSTADFIQHLDGQMHSIHCSFIPGADPTLGESGCRTVMLSPSAPGGRASPCSIRCAPPARRSTRASRPRERSQRRSLVVERDAEKRRTFG